MRHFQCEEREGRRWARGEKGGVLLLHGTFVLTPAQEPVQEVVAPLQGYSFTWGKGTNVYREIPIHRDFMVAALAS